MFLPRCGSAVPAAIGLSSQHRALYSDIPNDVAATPDGIVVVLDVTSVLWTSDDLGRSWRRVDLPAAVSPETPTAVAADDTSWLLGGSRAGEAFLFVVSRGAPDEYEEVAGDFTHRQDLMVPHIAAR